MAESVNEEITQAIEQTPGSVIDAQRARLVEEIQLMSEYATSEDVEFSEVLEKSLANLRIGSPLEEILAVHGQLRTLCAPATPTSLRATQTSGTLRVNSGVLNLLVNLGVGSLLAFMASSVIVEIVRPAAGEQGPAWLPLLEGVNILFAAALGSSFYALTISQRYIRNRTFDPKYNHTYVIRFVLGLAAGTILGQFGEAWFKGQGQVEGIVQQLGPAAFAIVGGYSAEAVSQILKRIADTLVTLVRGGQEDQLDAREAEMRAANRERMALEREEALAILHTAKENALRAEAGAQILDEIQSAIDRLRARE